MIANRPYSLARLRLQSSWPEKVKGRQIARGKQAEDPLPVGHRRGRGHVVAALLAVAAGHHLLRQRTWPVFRSRHSRSRFFCSSGAGDEDAILPNHRRRAAITRQRCDPRHVFRLAPLRRQIRLGSRAVEIRPPPLGPVLGATRGAEEQRQARERNRGPARPANKSATQLSHPGKVSSPAKSGKAFGLPPFGRAVSLAYIARSGLT